MGVEDFQGHKRQRPNGKAAPPLNLIEAGCWIGHEPKPRLFLDGSSRLIPMRNVTLLGGDGGTGKSLLALQLALACCTAIPHWIGMDVSTGPVLYLSAEDDENEIHRRVVEICNAEPGSDIEAIRGMLYVLNMVGQDATLAAEKGHTGVIEATELYHRVEGIIADLRPILVVYDNLADVYAGNENNRSAAKHFVGLLRHLALEYDHCGLLLGHPSLTGMSSGSGMSGSTAWSNSVRSRLYLKSGDDEDEDARVLETKKANYGRVGGIIYLRWLLSRFVRSQITRAKDRMTMDTQDIVRAEAGKDIYRTKTTSELWFGYWLADHLHADVGQGAAVKDHTATQAAQRLEIIGLLKQFEKGGVIHKVKRKDSNYEIREYYAAGPAEEEKQ